jgi:hypothetical protein
VRNRQRRNKLKVNDMLKILEKERARKKDKQKINGLEREGGERTRKKKNIRKEIKRIMKRQ